MFREIAIKTLFAFGAAVLFGYVLTRTFGGGYTPLDSGSDPFLNADPDAVVGVFANHADPVSIRLPAGGILEIASRDSSFHDMRQKVQTHDMASEHSGMDMGVSHDGISKRFSSGIFGPEEAYRVRIDRPGVYDFEDHLHPEIIIHVEAYERSN